MPNDKTTDPSDIIRNPNRSTNQLPQQPYVPEYQRLGKEPIMRGERMQDPFSSGENEFSTHEVISNRLPTQIIDNNDWVEIPAWSPPNAKPEQILEPEPSTPKPGEFILMVQGKTILTGSRELIEKKVKNIVYGEDSDFGDPNISLDDIVVLKRMTLKVGIFVNE